IVAIGKINDPPVLALSAINCVSIAMKLWCIPVITIGAYNNPKIRPPIAPPNSYNQVNPSDNQYPNVRVTGPTNKNVINAVTNIDSNGVSKLSNITGTIFRNPF